jgi:hypothetical protein
VDGGDVDVDGDDEAGDKEIEDETLSLDPFGEF